MIAPHAATTHPTTVLGRPRAPRCFNPRSRQRFILDRWRQLVGHLRREPSYPERLIIDRIVAIEWDLRRLDAKLDAGEELSGHALRARLAAENRLRLDLVALGLQPHEPPQPSAQDMLADIHKRYGGSTALSDGDAS